MIDRGRSFELAFAVWTAAALLSASASAAEPDAEMRTAFELGTGGDSELRLDVEAHGRTVVLRGSSIAGDDATLSLSCALCTRAELLSESRALGAAIVASRAKKRSCRIALEGMPRGTEVRIDGLLGNAANRAQTVEPGRHEIRAAGPRETRTSSFALEPGAAFHANWEEMEVDETKPRPLRIALFAGGMGLAFAAAGTAFLLLDGDCATTRLNADGKCESSHHLAPLGWSFVSAGAAAVVFGVLYGVLKRHDARSETARKGGAR